MATKNVPKQVRLSVEQNRKLKAIALARGCSESAVIRAAVDQLPDPDVDLIGIGRLEAAGLSAPEAPDPDPKTNEKLDALEAEGAEKDDPRSPVLSASDCIIEDPDGH